MTWIKFAIWLSGIYTAYYTALVGWDLLNGNRSAMTADINELSFAEDLEMVKEVPDEPSGTSAESPVVSSGGLSVKQTFNVAREEVIDYIRAVSF